MTNQVLWTREQNRRNLAAMAYSEVARHGATRSPWRYDAAAGHALQSASLRRPAILHYASWAA
jgi:hypothetical protein